VNKLKRIDLQMETVSVSSQSERFSKLISFVYSSFSLSS
jgi:hypothetical protein